MNRINELLVRDKFRNLEEIAEILKCEATALARNFFLLGDDVVVRYKKENNSFVFNIEINASRIKPFGIKL